MDLPSTGYKKIYVPPILAYKKTKLINIGYKKGRHASYKKTNLLNIGYKKFGTPPM